MAERFFDTHFVWWSSRDSIAAEKISLLAVAEVIFSVAAYWGIAWYFDTYAHLLISILVAPSSCCAPTNPWRWGWRCLADI